MALEVAISCFPCSAEHKMSDEVDTEENFNEDENNFDRNSSGENREFPDEEYDEDGDNFRFRNKRVRGGFR